MRHQGLNTHCVTLLVDPSEDIAIRVASDKVDADVRGGGTRERVDAASSSGLMRLFFEDIVTRFEL